jgi:hypothetical protein
MPSFAKIIAKLDAHYGRPKNPKAADPLAMIIYENIGYLVDDAKWDAAFASLKKEIGLNRITLELKRAIDKNHKARRHSSGITCRTTQGDRANSFE